MGIVSQMGIVSHSSWLAYYGVVLKCVDRGATAMENAEKEGLLVRALKKEKMGRIPPSLSSSRYPVSSLFGNQ
jgi:hypothetical protein